MVTPLEQRKLVIINVGANTSHSGLISPLYEDGHFFFMPIPEELRSSYPTLPSYMQILHKPDLYFVPKTYHNRTVHNDPEFETFTYGDHPTKGRAANLKYLAQGDLLFFFAGLTKIRNGKPTKDYRFYFVGFFEIHAVLKNVNNRPCEEDMNIFGRNAHIKEGEAKSLFDKFWVWKGSNNSQLFSKAALFDRELGENILVNSKGELYSWPEGKYLQLLGARTRTSRQIIGEHRKQILVKKILVSGNNVPLFKCLLYKMRLDA